MKLRKNADDGRAVVRFCIFKLEKYEYLYIITGTTVTYFTGG